MASGREDTSVLQVLRQRAETLAGAAPDYDRLMERLDGARFVLLGEASHGTHEFYRERIRITRRLIEEKGFRAVAVEADWPDAYRVNRFVRGDDGASAEGSLEEFKRFPAWMWRNTEVLAFIRWLRAYNAERPEERRVGFYGLDLYSLHGSIRAVLEYLDRVDPEAARRARRRYGCFEQFGDDPQAYGYATVHEREPGCEDEVVRQLVELQQRAAEAARHDGRGHRDELFFAEQNARLVVNAEEYYRAMYHGRVNSWNLRDRHMAETLTDLVDHLGGSTAKVAVWAHNSHLGDARATDMGRWGELNLGQLVRERYGAESHLLGFSTDCGTVTAASDWGGAAERKRVRPGLRGSYEALFHETGVERFLLPLKDDPWLQDALSSERLERAIGVIYAPHTERQSHYFHAALPRQFDTVIHIDETRALEPLETTSEWVEGELPETYPTAL